MSTTAPSLELLWDAFTGYQRTAALKAAIEHDVFTEVAAGANTIDALAARTHAAPRGLRALLTRLVVDGFLERSGEVYALSPTSATFLDRSSPGYAGSAIEFVASDRIVECFAKLTEAVRRGGTAVTEDGTLSAENPVWVKFARSMAPLAGMSALLLANLLEIERAGALEVLDVAAGHGMFGIVLARVNPQVQVTAIDWANVLAVAEEHARAAGVADRFHTRPGSAFEVPFGEGYDLVLLPNFLHHFDPPTCETILRKCRAALKPGGRVVLVEFVPDDDRTGPPDAVRFSLVMLATTPAGDAWTFADYRAMFERTGFHEAVLQELPPTPARVVIATAP